MSEILKWSSINPIAATILLVSLGIVVIAVVIIYLVSFLQGRELSFWPPKIGEKPNLIGSNAKNNTDATNNKFLQEKNPNESHITFHINRDEMKKPNDLIKKAKEEIIFYGVQHSYLSHGFEYILAEKVKEGCKIKILMMNFKSKFIEEIASQRPNMEITKLKTDLKDNLNVFMRWYKKLDDEDKVLVDIKTYNIFPTAAYIFIDKDNKSNRFIQVEPLLFGFSANDLPHYTIESKSDDRIFKRYIDSFTEIWKKSYKHIQCVENSE